MSTKKVKRMGRLGARYGVGIRKRLLKIESEQFAPHNCPECSAPKVRRTAPGIFYCKKCGYEFAGGAYVPETMAGSIVKKMVSQKVFLPNMRSLVETKTGLPKALEGAAEEKGDSEGIKPVSKTSKKKRKKE
ncbi:MAG: 50S ribosomal protein L37ae [Candidatus ainarchaeum sp.]|nr:50S ribosomal protein L37ae [Candidatus ainarchaeum sp.]